ncbi:TRAP transporter substrate-binding protein [Cystobacter fuscus]
MTQFIGRFTDPRLLEFTTGADRNPLVPGGEGIRAAGLPGEGEAENMSGEIEIIYGSLWPTAHFGHHVARSFGERLAELTDGRIRVKVTPPTSDKQLVSALIKGEIQMSSGHAIQTEVPELGLSYLPYLYKTFDHFKRIWTLGQSPVSDSLIRHFERRKVPARVLGYSLIGFRDMILRDRQLTQSGGLKGLRVRVDGSDTSIATFKAIGSTPVTIEYHQVQQALRNGEVDAAENTTYNLIYMDWYKECRHVTLTEHIALLNVELINLDFWQRLDSRDRERIEECMALAVRDFNEISAIRRDTAVGTLKKKGLQVNKIQTEELERKVLRMKEEFVKEYRLTAEYEHILSTAPSP